MDPVGMKILPVVTAKSGENPDRRKGKGFSATFVSRELVDPNCAHNLTHRNGNPVNIPEPYRHLPQVVCLGICDAEPSFRLSVIAFWRCVKQRRRVMREWQQCIAESGGP